MEIEIALRKHDLPHEFSLGARKQAGKLPTDVAERDRAGRVDITALPLVTIDGETAKDFDDAVYCGEGRRRLPPHRRDRRRLALRQGRRSPRPRCPRPRHVRLLPAARHSDASGGTVQRALLAEAGGGPFVHGLRHGGDRRGQDREVPVLPCRDALARAAHVHAGVGLALGAEARAARGEAAAAAPRRPLRAVPRAEGRARGARRDRLRQRRDAARVRRPRQDRPDRAGRAQRRAQADRGVHARGERVHRRVSRAAQPSRALPRARGADAGEAPDAP